MDNQKVDMFIMSNGKFFPGEKISYIKEKLMAIDENKSAVISSMQFKSPTTALILAIFLGCLGVDRFYLGKTGSGIVKLLTCGGVGIWTFIDWFLVTNATKKTNYAKLSSVL